MSLPGGRFRENRLFLDSFPKIFVCWKIGLNYISIPSLHHYIGDMLYKEVCRPFTGIRGAYAPTRILQLPVKLYENEECLSSLSGCVVFYCAGDSGRTGL